MTKPLRFQELIRALWEAPDADAGIIACFDDTGARCSPSVARFPVVGFAKPPW